MIRKVLALLMVILFGAFNANAQSSCDKLYATAVKYQQRMTVASQNQAIYNPQNETFRHSRTSRLFS